MAMPTEPSRLALRMAMAIGRPKWRKKMPPKQKTPGAMATTLPWSRFRSNSALSLTRGNI